MRVEEVDDVEGKRRLPRCSVEVMRQGRVHSHVTWNVLIVLRASAKAAAVIRKQGRLAVRVMDSDAAVCRPNLRVVQQLPIVVRESFWWKEVGRRCNPPSLRRAEGNVPKRAQPTSEHRIRSGFNPSGPAVAK